MAKDVIASLHNAEVDRCVDIFRRPDGTFGFKEFRRDAEDGGGWTLICDYPHLSCDSAQDAAAAAKAQVPWLRDLPSEEAKTVGPSVTATMHNEDADRCVKIVRNSNGGFGFKEFRRDPEDAGGWTLVGDSALATHPTEQHALAAAQNAIGWLRDLGQPVAKD
jgi:hypothetical protein